MARIGDVYEIDTPKGKGYFQYWGKVNRTGSLIRVLQGVYDKESIFDENLIDKKELFGIFFPVETARRQKIATRIGKYNIPSFAKEAPLMRTTSYNIKMDYLVVYLIREIKTLFFQICQKISSLRYLK